LILDRIWKGNQASAAPAAIPAQAPAAPEPPPADSVQISSGDKASESADYEKKKRFVTDLGLLAAGDIPAMVSIGANFGWLPVPAPFLAPLNAFNAMTGALGIASDISVVRDCVTNPDVPLKDKLVDVAHIGNDLINTGASMVPLFVTIPGPLSVAGAVFAGGQILGALGDGAKLLWDKHRGGEQSAHADGDQPRKLIMDRFERRMGQIPMLLATLGSHSMLTNGAGLALPAALAGTMVTFGGAFGVVYGMTQVRKSKQLLGQLETLKAEGVRRFDMPQWTGRGLKTSKLNVDTAITRVKRQKWLGIGQTAASASLIVAGVMASPTLLVCGIAASTAFGLASAALQISANRRQISYQAHKALAHAKQEVGREIQALESLGRGLEQKVLGMFNHHEPQLQDEQPAADVANDRGTPKAG